MVNILNFIKITDFYSSRNILAISLLGVVISAVAFRGKIYTLLIKTKGTASKTEEQGKDLSPQSTTSITNQSITKPPVRTENITIGGTEKVDSISFKHFPRKPEPQILETTELKITKLDIIDTELKSIVEQNPKLTHLNLESCKKFTNEGFAFLQNCKELTHINLSETKISDEGLELITKGCPKLTHLNLESCKKITNEGFAYLTNVKDLVELNLSNTKISDKGLEFITKGCPKLAHLNLEICTGITNFSFLQNLKDLIELDLSYTKISDEGLGFITKHCPKLAHLNLECCYKISDKGFKDIVNFTQIRYVNVSKTLISGECFNQIILHCRNTDFKYEDCLNMVNVATLMDRYTKAWKSEEKFFDFLDGSFDLEKFSTRLFKHAEKFKKSDVQNEDHFGYIEKFDLNFSDNPQIFVRADLHGDLKSLIENLRTLQEQKLLDKYFKCNPGVHLVFLGDYCDRGKYGTQILELLMQLREENPEQVHLIRGNHESIEVNNTLAGGDFNLIKVIYDNKAKTALESFYETLSLTTYFSVKQGEGEKREYVQCTHGLFEPTMDPAPLLDHPSSVGYLPVPRARILSDRIQRIDRNSPLFVAARRIVKIKQKYSWKENITVYNWADVRQDGKTKIGSLGSREYALSARDIRYYLDLSSERHKVQMIIRGHQHFFQHLTYEDQVLVTTLSVGMDSVYYFDQPDRSYIIKPVDRVENWTKRAILRTKGNNRTDEITKELPLVSASV